MLPEKALSRRTTVEGSTNGIGLNTEDFDIRAGIEDETVSGSIRFIAHPWSKVASNTKMADILDKTGSDFNLLPEIGADDTGYKNFMEQKRGSAGYPGGLFESGERVHSEAEMQKKAREFLETFVTGLFPEGSGAPGGDSGQNGTIDGITGWGQERFIVNSPAPRYSLLPRSCRTNLRG